MIFAFFEKYFLKAYGVFMFSRCRKGSPKPKKCEKKIQVFLAKKTRKNSIKTLSKNTKNTSKIIWPTVSPPGMFFVLKKSTQLDSIVFRQKPDRPFWCFFGFWKEKSAWNPGYFLNSVIANFSSLSIFPVSFPKVEPYAKSCFYME